MARFKQAAALAALAAVAAAQNLATTPVPEQFDFILGIAAAAVPSSTLSSASFSASISSGTSTISSGTTSSSRSSSLSPSSNDITTSVSTSTISTTLSSSSGSFSASGTASTSSTSVSVSSGTLSSSSSSSASSSSSSESFSSTFTPTSTSSSLSSSLSSSSSSASPSSTFDCTARTGIYGLQNVNTLSVASLTAQPGTSGSYIRFLAYSGGLASRFILQPDCSLVSFDGGLLAMARDQDVAPKVVWLFPNTAIAQSQLSGTWTRLTCSAIPTFSGVLLQANVGGNNLFQIENGPSGILLIGSQVTQQAINIRLVPCSDGTCFQQPDP